MPSTPHSYYLVMSLIRGKLCLFTKTVPVFKCILFDFYNVFLLCWCFRTLRHFSDCSVEILSSDTIEQSTGKTLNTDHVKKKKEILVSEMRKFKDR